MTITETFPAPVTKAGELFWLPCYINLSRAVYDGYVRNDESYELAKHIQNCATRWGITRRCALALLTGEASYEVTPEHITITRIVEEL